MKPRNHVVLAFIKCSKKQGAHVKSAKANRRKDTMDFKKLINNKKEIDYKY